MTDPGIQRFIDDDDAADAAVFKLRPDYQVALLAVHGLEPSR